MDIRLTDDYELRRVDSLNWQLYQMKEKKNGKNRGEVGWVPVRCYPRSVADALEWLAEHVPKRDWGPGTVDLREAAAKMRELERDVARHAEAFERGLRDG